MAWSTSQWLAGSHILLHQLGRILWGVWHLAWQTWARDFHKAVIPVRSCIAHTTDMIHRA